MLVWPPTPRHAQVWDVPATWSLKDAATVPVAYLTAYYALLMRAGLRKGQSVLVHSGTGAVGLAAIRIAHFRGCEVNAIRRPCALHCVTALSFWSPAVHATSC